MPRGKGPVLAALCLLALQRAEGDLGAAARRRAAEGGAPHPSWRQTTGPLVVQLNRVGARAQGAHHGHTRDSFYVGNISVGHPPQQLQVLFDTASGHVLLAHRACKSPACLEHKRYSPWESSTAMDVNPDGQAVQQGSRIAKGPVNRTVVTVAFTQSDLGHGNAKGVLVRDDVCLVSSTKGGAACANLALLAATTLDDQPFRAMPHDGILGLALEGLAAGALSSFYERLLDGSHELLPHFGMSLGRTTGEIVFGGHSRLAEPLRWFPVAHPDEGFWQVEIREIRVGNATVDPCTRGCRGIIDSGSSSLGVEEDRLENLLHSLKTHSVGGKCQGPELELDLGGFSLTLEAEDYTGTTCETELGLLDLDPKEFAGIYALGTAVLHRYYTAFDWAAARVGFAPVAVSPSSKRASLAAAVEAVVV